MEIQAFWRAKKSPRIDQLLGSINCNSPSRYSAHSSMIMISQSNTAHSHSHKAPSDVIATLKSSSTSINYISRLKLKRFDIALKL